MVQRAFARLAADDGDIEAVIVGDRNFLRAVFTYTLADDLIDLALLARDDGIEHRPAAAFQLVEARHAGAFKFFCANDGFAHSISPNRSPRGPLLGGRIEHGEIAVFIQPDAVFARHIDCFLRPFDPARIGAADDCQH